LRCHMLQSSQQTPWQFHLTGNSQSPHGLTLAFLCGPGFSSMSPDSIIVIINTFLYLLVCVGRHSGRLPVQCILMFIELWIRCWWSHNFAVSLVLLRIMCISNITVSVNMMIQYSAEKNHALPYNRYAISVSRLIMGMYRAS
jgi:hypothetical protein